MSKLLFAGFLILLCSMLSGCYTEFDPDINQSPVLCLNSEITAGKPVEARVTRTWRYTEGIMYDDNAILVKDADVRLYVNGNEYERLRPVQRDTVEYGRPYTYHYYQGTYCPQTGDEIRLVAVSDRYGSAEGEVKVPEPPIIENIEWKLDSPTLVHGYPGSNLRCTLDARIYLRDRADTKDYYMFGYSISNPFVYDDPIFYPELEEWITPASYGILSCTYFDQSHEPIFSEHISALELIDGAGFGYTMFSDMQFSGRTYPLHIVMTLEHRMDNADIEELWHSILNFKISALSDSYYNHLLTVWQFDEGLSGMLAEAGLGAPVNGYSNVSTRAGIVVARNVTTVPVDFGEALKEMWQQK
ncbi:MAG: DUF4249 domain-containing protein [Muribaculaceae bacterium]|nr:DUF4249 domain-containing protein [Muribaculaceae bacterium]